MNKPIKFDNGTLIPIITVQNKKGEKIWDVYDATIYRDANFAREIFVVTEHGTINENTPKEALKHFISFNRVENLIVEEKNLGIIFLGKLYKKDGMTRFDRHYIPFYSRDGKTAQELFNETFTPILELARKKSEEIKSIEDNQKKKQEIYQINKKYGFTEEEYDALMLYKSDDYFIPATLLHEIPLEKLMERMPIGDPISKLDYFKDPKKASNFYCNIYSAMCKFRKFYDKNIIGYRMCSELYKNEMEKTGETSSLLSFMPKGRDIRKYGGQRKEPIELTGRINKNVPVFDYGIFQEKDWEPTYTNLEEIIVPPFMRITYKGNDYNYYVDISDNNCAFTANDEALMNRLEKEIFGQEISDIIKKYYSDTYEYAFNRGEKPSKDLERKFVAWQQKFKTYLRLRFKKINQEILKQQSYKQTISWLKKMKYLLTTSPNGSTRKHK